MARLQCRHFVALLCVFTFVTPLLADTFDPQSILAELTHQSFAKREAASQQLMSDPDLTSDQIDTLYESTDSEEARQRLVDVARHQMLWNIARERYGESDRASLGVSLGGISVEQAASLGQPAVYVNRTCPGFPAFVVLEAGDLILSIDGKRPDSHVAATEVVNFYIAQIQSHKPGEDVVLEVRRGGRMFEQNVTLSSLDALAAMYQNTAGVRQLPENPPQQDPLGRIVINGVQRQRPLNEKFDLLWIARLRNLIATSK